eukprot:CAMPEP_0113873220 /NCGR_PEP_ID=MMETSP0780_2-20120614/3648_1 /TAXON_ID=652834 /ORGANISM="Palpitomonas bilix" /LENGTH=101 /DNA_ID=CAMNT_0000858839 /DNA_START=80 /DNA_END=385 /DNA_ORIENTATION=+ /assembly_acc=CAM_ASM_000599
MSAANYSLYQVQEAEFWKQRVQKEMSATGELDVNGGVDLGLPTLDDMRPPTAASAVSSSIATSSLSKHEAKQRIKALEKQLKEERAMREALESKVNSARAD